MTNSGVAAKPAYCCAVSDADAAFLRDSQVPINMSVFESKLTNAAWRTRPSWAVIATEDKAFDQAMLLHMAKSGTEFAPGWSRQRDRKPVITTDTLADTWIALGSLSEISSRQISDSAI